MFRMFLASLQPLEIFISCKFLASLQLQPLEIISSCKLLVSLQPLQKGADMQRQHRAAATVASALRKEGVATDLVLVRAPLFLHLRVLAA
eukprot:473036-Rhodomonas_salina.1